MKSAVPLILSFFLCALCGAQHISEFESLDPLGQDTNFNIPSTHTFQYLIQNGDNLDVGGPMPDNLDFSGYVPRDGSSKFGYLSVNSESIPKGAVTILDIEFDDALGKWMVDKSEAVDFSFGLPAVLLEDANGKNLGIGSTVANCSGTVTPWNTIITCEEWTNKDVIKRLPTLDESLIKVDGDISGYDGYGWAIEIDPATKTVIDQDDSRPGPDKLWAMGNFKHENVVIHSNLRTVYLGADDTKDQGYLFKFVADAEQDLSSGSLFVYGGNKQDSHEWVKLKNTSKWERNNTLFQCDSLKNLNPSRATSFGGIEDVEINPIDGMVYFAVKRESIGDISKKGVIYRFKDSSSGIEDFNIYAGGNSVYDGVEWGQGNDNLVFDDLGNLWVAQDGSFSSGDKNYIWVIENGHSQSLPKVKIFARTPTGSEPTGLTFTPDYKYIFMSIQHPSSGNSSTKQPDAFDIDRYFDKDVVLVIARNEHLGKDLTLEDQDVLITQYYHDDASNSKWIEVKNISGKDISSGSYFIDLYDSASLSNIASVTPKASEPIPAMVKDEVILFQNRASPTFPVSQNLGPARKIVSSVCNFEGDDVVLITTTPGNRKYINRKDIIGSIPKAVWGENSSLVRGGNSGEVPERNFVSTNWIELDSLKEVSLADKLKNIALGTHVIGPAFLNGSSWDNNSPPDRTRNTVINGNYVGGQEDFAAFDLKINDAGSLNFEDNTEGNNKNVFVHGNLTIDDGAEFIIGDTESLIIKNSSAIVSGKIEKIEKSTLRNHPNDITYWSSPVEDEQIETVFRNVDENRVFCFDQTKHLLNDPTSETYWDVWVNKSTGPMEVARGYAAEGFKGSVEIHKISFKGRPNFDVIETRILDFEDDASDQNDYNLIGNPYPAAIDIEAFLKTNTEINEVIDGTVYLWTHATPLSGGVYVADDYATYNFFGSVPDGVDINIGSGQGFFVRALKADKVTFDPSMILVGANDQFFKGTGEKEGDEKNRLWINLKASDNSFKQILIGFDENATDQMDPGYDALYLNGNQPIAFYSVLDDRKLSIQGLGTFREDKVVQIGFDAEVEGLEMTIDLARKEGVLRDQDILIFDQNNDIIHDLNISPYTFNFDGKGAFQDRFRLLFNSAVLGLDEEISVKDIKIYMQGQDLIIDAQNIIEQVKVYDALGRLIRKERPQSAYFKLNLDQIRMGGFFIVELFDEQGRSISKKMVKY